MKSMKKMLAAVMVLAVALAGVFVVIGGDEADATYSQSVSLTTSNHYIAGQTNIVQDGE